VLSGSLTIDHEALEPQSGRRLPAGTALDATVGPEGTRLWIRIAPAIQYADVEAALIAWGAPQAGQEACGLKKPLCNWQSTQSVPPPLCWGRKI
jgi:hypothetical protein